MMRPPSNLDWVAMTVKMEAKGERLDGKRIAAKASTAQKVKFL